MSEARDARGRTGDLVFVGDVHLDVGDPSLDEFLRFLGSLERSASRVVFMGDLFNVWIGQRELEQPHQSAVLSELARLRASGIVVRYVEGNRDFRIGPAYVGAALDEASSDGLLEEFGGRRLWAVHGDLANPRDRQYRTWRRVSRSPLFWRLFNLLSRKRRLRLAESIERGMRSSNRAFKGAFPEEAVRGYAAKFLDEGADGVVLGHFHIERDLEATDRSPPGRILVLPEWREARRHLRVTPEGQMDFVDSETG